MLSGQTKERERESRSLLAGCDAEALLEGLAVTGELSAQSNPLEQAEHRNRSRWIALDRV